VERLIYESLLQFIIILPLVLLFLKKYNKENICKVLVFGMIFIVYSIIINLPVIYNSLRVVGGNWNWTGKILGILFGVLCYFLFRKLFEDYDFFTFRQDKTFFKKGSILSFVVVLFASIIWFIFGKSEFDVESLVFQLLPGIDEEIMYRGILLGLLMSSLKGESKFIGNPSLLITSILFGLIHALKLNKSLDLSFDLIYFLQTGLAGYAWGWIAIKTKSILLAILSHNFSNFFGTLATMIK